MIPIQNIYYMLSYAFQVLNEQGYKNIATEQFHNTAELMAAILEKGIAIQLKRGLGKEYIPQTEALSSLRGKIDIAESIKTQSMLRKQLICTYDEFSVNSIMNRIIKSEVIIRCTLQDIRFEIYIALGCCIKRTVRGVIANLHKASKQYARKTYSMA